MFNYATEIQGAQCDVMPTADTGVNSVEFFDRFHKTAEQKQLCNVGECFCMCNRESWEQLEAKYYIRLCIPASDLVWPCWVIAALSVCVSKSTRY